MERLLGDCVGFGGSECPTLSPGDVAGDPPCACSLSLMFAFRRLHNLFENVLNSQAGTEETHAVFVHQLQQGPAVPVDTGDAFQVNRDLPVGLVRTGSLPAVFELGNKGPRQSPFDLQCQQVVEFFYQLEDKDNGVNEILAVNDHQFLVLERDGDGGNSAKFKKLFLADLTGATDISDIASLPRTGAPDGVKAVSKTPFLDLLAPAYGLAGPTFPEKIEGIAFGPDRPDGSHLLIVTQDNDFIASQPSQIFAFTVAPAALPGWQPQRAGFSEACVSPSPEMKPK